MNRKITTVELHELMETNHINLKELEHRSTAIRLGRQVAEGYGKAKENNAQ